MKPLEECALYTFVDSAYLHGRDPLALTRDLCAGGADLIQLRAKDWPPERVEEVAGTMREITAAEGVGLVINDHLDVAERTSADVCHLGQEDFFGSGFRHVAQLPRKQPTQPKIGLSTHAIGEAERAVAAGADYIAIGPVFATGTKPTARPVTLEYVRWAAAHVKLPWFAIGGIHPGNLDEVLAAGAKRICVVSAILNASDVQAVCQQFKARLEGAKRQ